MTRIRTVSRPPLPEFLDADGMGEYFRLSLVPTGRARLRRGWGALNARFRDNQSSIASSLPLSQPTANARRSSEDRARDASRRPAVEILRGSAVTEKYILENRLADLHDYLESGDAGMQSFDQHLLKMYRAELISGTEAMRWASNSESLAMAMRGISRTGQKIEPLQM